MPPPTLAGTLLTAAVGAAILGAACGSTPSGPIVASIGIDATEMEFSPRRIVVPDDGRVTFELRNEGALAHTFVIEGRGFKLRAFEPGDRDLATVNLPDGAWFVYCDIEGHRDAGMEGELFVGDVEIPPEATTTVPTRTG